MKSDWIFVYSTHINVKENELHNVILESFS